MKQITKTEQRVIIVHRTEFENVSIIYNNLIHGRISLN